MKKKELFEAFEKLFPEWVPIVKDCKKIGSRVIVLYFYNGKSLAFMYYSDENWQLGTKLWRKRPEYGNGSIGRKQYDENAQPNIDQ